MSSSVTETYRPIYIEDFSASPTVVQVTDTVMGLGAVTLTPLFTASGDTAAAEIGLATGDVYIDTSRAIHRLRIVGIPVPPPPVAGFVQILGTPSTTSTTVTGVSPSPILGAFIGYPVLLNNAIGLTIRTTAWGVFTTANGTDYASLYVKNELDSTVYNTIQGPSGMITDQAWKAIWEITILTLGAPGTVQSVLTLQTGANVTTSVQTSTSIDTTQANPLTVDVSWSNAISGDTFTIYGFYSEVF